MPGVSAITMSFGRSEGSGDTGVELHVQHARRPRGGDVFGFDGRRGCAGRIPRLFAQRGRRGRHELDDQSATTTLESETGWSDSGGGQSSYESEPSYQRGVQSTGMRQIPDISFDADPNTGVAVYDSYDYGSSSPWAQIGGTSVSSPCWAGLIAIGDQLRVAEGLTSMDGPTQTLPLLYGMKAADFHDITVGNNGHAAGVGYEW